jgi:hypothetical protein
VSLRALGLNARAIGNLIVEDSTRFETSSNPGTKAVPMNAPATLAAIHHHASRTSLLSTSQGGS